MEALNSLILNINSGLFEKIQVDRSVNPNFLGELPFLQLGLIYRYIHNACIWCACVRGLGGVWKFLYDCKCLCIDLLSPMKGRGSNNCWDGGGSGYNSLGQDLLQGEI